MSHKGSRDQEERRDQIEHPSTDDSKPAGERPSETELAALPVKKRLKLAATRTDSGTVVSKPDVSNAGFGRSSELIKIEPPDASVKVEVGVESSPCAEPLLCVRCTRPMELRSCVERKWLDRIYKSARYLRAVEKLEKETRVDGGEGVVATGKSDCLSMKAAHDEPCPWCSALPVGSSDLRDCGPGGSVWCPRARDLVADVGADLGADLGADAVGDEPGMPVVPARRRRTPTPCATFAGTGRRGEPVVVREIEVAYGRNGQNDWSLETLERALGDDRHDRYDDRHDRSDGDGVTPTAPTMSTDRMVPVVDACKEWAAGVRSTAVVEAMTARDFFEGLAEPRGCSARMPRTGWTAGLPTPSFVDSRPVTALARSRRCPFRSTPTRWTVR